MQSQTWMQYISRIQDQRLYQEINCMIHMINFYRAFNEERAEYTWKLLSLQCEKIRRETTPEKLETRGFPGVRQPTFGRIAGRMARP